MSTSMNISTPTPHDSDYYDPLHLSESLVPSQKHKSATITSTTFDSLLIEPLLLKEDLKEGCGGQLWPAGMVLAKYVLRQHHSDLKNKSILELGTGGGLVGLAVAKGCDIDKPVFITDQAPMLSLMQENTALNGLISRVTPMILNWGEPIPDEILRPVDVVLAADCVYFEPAFPLLLETLIDLITEKTLCYFCFKKRRKADMRFVKMARKVFEVREVEDDVNKEVYSKEQIFLWTMRRRKRV